VYGDDDDPRIVLFGDSHAAQWFPALTAWAAANGYAVENHTKSACRSVMVAVQRNGVAYTECEAWRAEVIDRINAEPPALVLLSNYSAAPTGVSDDAWAEEWEQALTTTLRTIGAPTAVVADSPDLEATPAICLSSRLDSADSCGRPRADALSSPILPVERRISAAEGSTHIDLNDFICSADRCGPIIGDTLVYRDGHHLTATFSALLDDELGAALAPVLEAAGR
jgi:hypothetical protein